MALTPRKRKFADALLSGASNREAAIQAGYSERTASQQGSRLAKDADVLAHMERRQAVKERQAEARAEGKAFNLSGLAREYDDPADFLLALMNDDGEDVKLRADAAKALMPYKHARLGEQGKRQARQSAAREASKGRFAPSAPPRLVVNNK